MESPPSRALSCLLQLNGNFFDFSGEAVGAGVVVADSRSEIAAYIEGFRADGADNVTEFGFFLLAVDGEHDLARTHTAAFEGRAGRGLGARIGSDVQFDVRLACRKRLTGDNSSCPFAAIRHFVVNIAVFDEEGKSAISSALCNNDALPPCAGRNTSAEIR